MVVTSLFCQQWRQLITIIHKLPSVRTKLTKLLGQKRTKKLQVCPLIHKYQVQCRQSWLQFQYNTLLHFFCPSLVTIPTTSFFCIILLPDFIKCICLQIAMKDKESLLRCKHTNLEKQKFGQVLMFIIECVHAFLFVQMQHNEYCHSYSSDCSSLFNLFALQNNTKSNIGSQDQTCGFVRHIYGLVNLVVDITVLVKVIQYVAAMKILKHP